jgi:hypothetical protein
MSLAEKTIGPARYGPRGPDSLQGFDPRLDGSSRQGGLMNSPTPYFDWAFIHISLPNLVVIAGMIVVFAIALIAPFPHGRRSDDGGH